MDAKRAEDATCDYLLETATGNSSLQIIEYFLRFSEIIVNLHTPPTKKKRCKLSLATVRYAMKNNASLKGIICQIREANNKHPQKASSTALGETVIV